MNNTHEFFAVLCKTPLCDTDILLHCIGISGSRRTEFLPPDFTDFKQPCPTCMNEHIYKRADVIEISAPAPPEGFQTSKFFQFACYPKGAS